MTSNNQTRWHYFLVLPTEDNKERKWVTNRKKGVKLLPEGLGKEKRREGRGMLALEVRAGGGCEAGGG